MMSPSADNLAAEAGGSSNKVDLLTSKLRSKRPVANAAHEVPTTTQGASMRTATAVQPSASSEGAAVKLGAAAAAAGAPFLPLTQINSASEETSTFSPFDPNLLRTSDDHLGQPFSADTPKKRIVNPRQLERWQESDTIKQLGAWIAVCNEAVVGKKLRQEVYCSVVSACSSARRCVATPSQD